MASIERSNYIIANIEDRDIGYLSYFYKIFDKRQSEWRNTNAILSVRMKFGTNIDSAIFITRFRDMLKTIFPSIVIDYGSPGLGYHLFIGNDDAIYINYSLLLKDRIFL